MANLRKDDERFQKGPQMSPQQAAQMGAPMMPQMGMGAAQDRLNGNAGMMGGMGMSAPQSAALTAPIMQGSLGMMGGMGAGQMPGVSAAALGDAAGALGAQKPIGEEQIIEAEMVLKKYKTGKHRLERRIVSAQQWWKLRNWEQIAREDGIRGASDYKSNSAWLWNCLVGKHADFMDAYPEPNILPRAEDDEEEADRLS